MEKRAAEQESFNPEIKRQINEIKSTSKDAFIFIFLLNLPWFAQAVLSEKCRELKK